MVKNKENRTSLAEILQKVSIVLMILMVALGVFLFFKYRPTYQQLVDFTPQNPWLGAFVIIAIYVVKSFSLFIPLPIFFLAVAIIYDPVPAFLINLAGVVLSLSLPYYIGKYSGSLLLERLTTKYPKVKKIDEIKADNEILLSFILKLSGVFPCDLSSLLLGTMNLDYRKFMIGAILGHLPHIVAWTFLGDSLDLSSPKFYLAIAGIIIVIVGSTIIYRKVAARRAGGDTAKTDFKN